MHIWFRRMISTVRNMWVIILNAENILQVLQVRRELRVPGALGNAIGIVGGLIIGDAAVSANLVSPIVVMIVALTALGSMVIPDEEFASAFRLMKYGFLFLGGYLGIYGIVLGIYLLISHLSGLLSFGVPYLVPFVRKHSVSRVGDGIWRIPFKKRQYRPVYAKKEQSLRLKHKVQTTDAETEKEAQNEVRRK